MNDLELEAERVALLTNEQALMKEHTAVHATPDDVPGQRMHHIHVKMHKERLRAYCRELRQRWER